MVHVQKRQLSPFLIHNNEDRVPKIPDFGDIKQPQQICRRGIHGIERVTGCEESVVIPIANHPGFNCHVGAQEYLRDIVDELDGIQGHGRDETQFHNRTAHQHKGQVDDGNRNCRFKICQEPALFTNNEKSNNGENKYRTNLHYVK